MPQPSQPDSTPQPDQPELDLGLDDGFDATASLEELSKKAIDFEEDSLEEDSAEIDLEEEAEPEQRSKTRILIFGALLLVVAGKCAFSSGDDARSTVDKNGAHSAPVEQPKPNLIRPAPHTGTDAENVVKHEELTPSRQRVIDEIIDKIKPQIKISSPQTEDDLSALIDSTINDMQLDILASDVIRISQAFDRELSQGLLKEYITGDDFELNEASKKDIELEEKLSTELIEFLKTRVAERPILTELLKEYTKTKIEAFFAEHALGQVPEKVFERHYIKIYNEFWKERTSISKYSRDVEAIGIFRTDTVAWAIEYLRDPSSVKKDSNEIIAIQDFIALIERATQEVYPALKASGFTEEEFKAALLTASKKIKLLDETATKVPDSLLTFVSLIGRIQSSIGPNSQACYYVRTVPTRFQREIELHQTLERSYREQIQAEINHNYISDNEIARAIKVVAFRASKENLDMDSPTSLRIKRIAKDLVSKAKDAGHYLEQRLFHENLAFYYTFEYQTAFAIINQDQAALSKFSQLEIEARTPLARRLKTSCESLEAILKLSEITKDKLETIMSPILDAAGLLFYEPTKPFNEQSSPNVMHYRYRYSSGAKITELILKQLGVETKTGASGNEYLVLPEPHGKLSPQAENDIRLYKIVEEGLLKAVSNQF
ncbi:MAG: hypothetical protein R3A13_04830, partial [Bdellovibrionota bacterium]